MTTIKATPVGLSLFREIEFKGELNYVTQHQPVKIDNESVKELKRILINRDIARISIDLDEVVNLAERVDRIETSSISKFRPYNNLLIELSATNGTKLLVIITSDEKNTYARQLIQAAPDVSWYAEPFFIKFGDENEGISIKYLAGVKKTDRLFGAENTVEEDIKYFIIMLSSIFQAINSRETHLSEAPKLSRKKNKNLRPVARNFYCYKTLLITPEFIDRSNTGNSSIVRNPVRYHSRRAHIRKLKSGKEIFVKECSVGNPDNGVIDKDYRFTANALTRI